MLLNVPGTARIVRDIEVRYTQAGSAVASTAIVNSKKWKDKNSGELMEDACFIDVVAFGQTGDFLNQHFKKGDILSFVAEIQQDKWEDKDGNKRSKHSLKLTSVDFALSSNSDGAGGYTPKAPEERGAPVAQGQQDNTNQNATPTIPEIDISEDEIPF